MVHNPRYIKYSSLPTIQSGVQHVDSLCYSLLFIPILLYFTYLALCMLFLFVPASSAIRFICSKEPGVTKYDTHVSYLSISVTIAPQWINSLPVIFGVNYQQRYLVLVCTTECNFPVHHLDFSSHISMHMLNVKPLPPRHKNKNGYRICVLDTSNL